MNNWKKIPHYFAIHDWVRKHKPIIKLCEKCHNNKKVELANVSGKYKKDINDYIWLCKSCHRKYDNIDTLKQWSINRIGKTNIDVYGEKRAKEISKLIRKKLLGKKWTEERKQKIRGWKRPHLSEWNKKNSGKTLEKIYGKKKAKLIKIKKRDNAKKMKRNNKGQFERSRTK